MTPRKAAVLLCHLPRGASVWIHQGGAMALSDETEAVFILEHVMNMQAWGKAPRSKRGKKPEMRPYPKALFEEDNKRAEFERNAKAFRRKYGTPKKLL